MTFFIPSCPWQLGGNQMRNLVLAKENKENKRFPSISDGALDNFATKYIPENTEKMTKWAVTAFQD